MVTKKSTKSIAKKTVAKKIAKKKAAIKNIPVPKKAIKKTVSKKKVTKKVAPKKVVLKKVVKKAVPKVKAPVKRVVPKRKVSKRNPVKKTGLKKAPLEVSFYLADGSVCRDLEDLAHALDDVADEIFEHHVSDFHNDFANWVEHVFEEKELAEKLRKSKKKDRHVIEVFKVVVKKK